MIGIPENDLRLRLDKVARLQGLHRAERSNVHEDGRLHIPMPGVKTSESRARTRIFLHDLETHGAYSTKKWIPPLA